MPAALLENTPQEVFGRNLANRKCSERRNVSRSFLTAVGSGNWKAGASAKAVQGPQLIKHQKRSRNRQVESKGRKTGADRLTGPDAGKVAGR